MEAEAIRAPQLTTMSVGPQGQADSNTAGLTSSVNHGPGQTVPNHAIAPVGDAIGVYHVGGRAHVLVDVFGGFT
jgi:hypothetical protein